MKDRKKKKKKTWKEKQTERLVNSEAKKDLSPNRKKEKKRKKKKVAQKMRATCNNPTRIEKSQNGSLAETHVRKEHWFGQDGVVPFQSLGDGLDHDQTKQNKLNIIIKITFFIIWIIVVIIYSLMFFIVWWWSNEFALLFSLCFHSWINGNWPLLDFLTYFFLKKTLKIHYWERLLNSNAMDLSYPLELDKSQLRLCEK